MEQRTIDGKACLQEALFYLSLGWAPLPLCPWDHVGIGKAHVKKCKNQGKAPWILWKKYQDVRPTETDLRYWWKEVPNSNVGLALGPVSGLIRVDVEGAAGEAALQAKSAGNIPDTLEFSSGRADGTGRGLLYQIPPGVELITTHDTFGNHQELRFQARGAQTVLPPSRHKDDNLYCWKEGHGPHDMKPTVAPAWLIAELSTSNGKAKKKTVEQWDEILAGVEDGSRHDSANSLIGKLLYSLRDLKDSSALRAILQVTLAWNERNDPPVDDSEIVLAFRNLLKKETARRDNEDQDNFESVIASQIDQRIEAQESPPCQNGTPVELPEWDLITLDSRPEPEYLFRSPWWLASDMLAATNGYLHCTAKQILTFNGLRHPALTQAGVMLRSKFKGYSGQIQRLLDLKQHRAVSREKSRPYVVAEFLWSQLCEAFTPKPDENGDIQMGTGYPVRLPDPDNRVIIKSDWLVQRSTMSADKINRKEIMDSMDQFGMKPEVLGEKKKRSRWWTADQQSLDSISTFLLGEEP